MDSLFDLNVLDEQIYEKALNVGFWEFCEDVSELTEYADSFTYLEAVNSRLPGKNIVDGAKVKSNTRDISTRLGGAYTDVTDAGGSLIKTTVDLILRGVRLISKVLAFIMDRLADVPRLIEVAINKIGNIIKTGYHRIRGNITVHIRAEDIEALYNKNVITQLKQYVLYGKELVQGEFWSSFFNKRRSKNDTSGNIAVGTNDMKTMKNMSKIYTHLLYLEFSASEVELNNDRIVENYIGAGKNIKFTALNKKHYSCSYLQALKVLTEDLNTLSGEIGELQKAFNKKLEETEINFAFNKLNQDQRNLISKTITEMSKIISIVGNIYKYIISDTKSIGVAMDKVIKMNKKNAARAQKQANKENAKAQKQTAKQQNDQENNQQQ